MVNIDTWVSGCKVRAFDWIDGENIYMNIAYYRPGSSLEQPPAAEKSVLIPKSEEAKVRNFMHTIVNGLMRSA